MRSLTSLGWVIAFELGFAGITGLAFILLYALRSNWKTSPMGRHIMAFMVVSTVEFSTLLVAILWRLPAVSVGVVFFLVDLVYLQRLWLLWETQEEKDGQDEMAQ